jgi:hypothetical protein
VIFFSYLILFVFIPYIFLFSLGSYLVSGPPDMDIRDISFKLRYKTLSANVIDRFGHPMVHWWVVLQGRGHIVICKALVWLNVRDLHTV